MSKAKLKSTTVGWRYTHQVCRLSHLKSLISPIETRQRRQWHPTPVLLSGKSHGWRSLVGCSPWGCWESDTTERLHFYFSLSCIGEGNGNPLQYSCLENPREGGAWWAAVYGVAQSRTWLKWLSSSIETRRKAELVYRASHDMYGECHWPRWAIACISWWWCQKCPFLATRLWFTPYKVLVGCVLQLTKILNEK